MQSNVVNPAAEKSLLPPLPMDSDAHYQLENLRLEDFAPTQPEYDAGENRLDLGGISSTVYTHRHSPCGEPVPQLDLQDATRTPAELEPADTSSKGVLEIALTHGYPLGSELVPQPDYRPHTANDRRRYVEQVQLGAPILFFTQGSTLGIPLRDALASRFMHLDGRDDPMFADRGPSVHIRLVVSDYLLPTHSQENLTFDFSSCARALPGDPVAGLCALEQADSHQRLPESSPASNTREACTQRCKDHQAEMTDRRMEDEAEAKWRVGGRHIRVEDLVLVGLQHVSMGSWQAHVRVVWRQ
ncbi:hypothetical protein VTO73DRAFT_4833 [Trametes versicolor]